MSSPDGPDLPDEEREALVEVAGGAVVTSGGILTQRGLVTTLEYLLAVGLGPVVYGVYALAWRISQLAFRLVNFGAAPTLQRHIPAARDDPARQRRIAGLAYATTAGLGVLVAAAFAAGAGPLNDATVGHSAFAPTLILFALVVAFGGVVQIHAALLRAVGSAAGQVLFNMLLRPGVRLVVAAGGLALGFSLVDLAAGFVVGIAMLAVAGAPLTVLTTRIRPTLSGARREVGRFFNHAAPLALSAIGKMFQSRVDVLLVGVLLSAERAGVYNVVLVLIAVAWIPLKSFNQLLPPIAADLHSRGEMDTLRSLYTAITRLVVTLLLPLLAIQLVFGRTILRAFGRTFVDGYVPLTIYLIAVLVGSSVGATGWLLIVTDHQYARMALDWLLAVLNGVLTVALILEFGLAGAALGTTIAMGVQNSLQVLLLRRFESLWPVDATFLRPAGAGLAMVGAMAAVRWAMRGPQAALPTAPTGPLVATAGSVIGVATYALVLRHLGIDPRDRLVVRELAARYRQALRDWVGLPRSG